MMSKAELLQWIGFAFILGGYAAFSVDKFRGAAISTVGGAALVWWCLTLDQMPWGVLALQVGCIAINVYNMTVVLKAKGWRLTAQSLTMPAPKQRGNVVLWGEVCICHCHNPRCTCQPKRIPNHDGRNASVSEVGMPEGHFE